MLRRSSRTPRGVEAHYEERALAYRKRQEEALRRVPIRPEGPRKAVLQAYQMDPDARFPEMTRRVPKATQSMPEMYLPERRDYYYRDEHRDEIFRDDEYDYEYDYDYDGYYEADKRQPDPRDTRQVDPQGVTAAAITNGSQGQPIARPQRLHPVVPERKLPERQVMPERKLPQRPTRIIGEKESVADQRPATPPVVKETTSAPRPSPESPKHPPKKESVQAPKKESVQAPKKEAVQAPMKEAVQASKKEAAQPPTKEAAQQLRKQAVQQKLEDIEEIEESVAPQKKETTRQSRKIIKNTAKTKNGHYDQYSSQESTSGFSMFSDKYRIIGSAKSKHNFSAEPRANINSKQENPPGAQLNKGTFSSPVEAMAGLDEIVVGPMELVEEPLVRDTCAEDFIHTMLMPMPTPPKLADQQAINKGMEEMNDAALATYESNTCGIFSIAEDTNDIETIVKKDWYDQKKKEEQALAQESFMKDFVHTMWTCS